MLLLGFRLGKCWLLGFCPLCFRKVLVAWVVRFGVDSDFWVEEPQKERALVFFLAWIFHWLWKPGLTSCLETLQVSKAKPRTLRLDFRLFYPFKLLSSAYKRPSIAPSHPMSSTTPWPALCGRSCCNPHRKKWLKSRADTEETNQTEPNELTERNATNLSFEDFDSWKSQKLRAKEQCVSERRKKCQWETDSLKLKQLASEEKKT